MWLKDIGNFKSVEDFLDNKLKKFSGSEKTFKALFEFLFMERTNPMIEYTEGFSVKQLTYGEVYDSILSSVPGTKTALSSIPTGALVGLYMPTSVEWIKLFWSLLACGYRPLLLNSRVNDDALEHLIKANGVAAVVSDGKQFSVPTFNGFDVLKQEDASHIHTEWADEVVFMTSGTTDNIKLCAYSAENFYHQVSDSVAIVKNSDIAEGCDGYLKHLVILPFYHVFGFIAVYIWFSFASRIFVFPADNNPKTILATVRRHKITHIFAVPLVWDSIYREVDRKIHSKGEKTYKKFKKGIKLSAKLGKRFAQKSFAEIRYQLFGDSIRFLISGGSVITPEVLEFYNGIGYHLANGYGMTELGITSVEQSSKKKQLNTASIGKPIGTCEYHIAEDGELAVKCKTRAKAIILNGVRTETDYDTLFYTNDLVKHKNGSYYVEGRKDDLIVCENGENLNPVIAEQQLNIYSAKAICLFADMTTGQPALIISAKNCYTKEKLNKILDSAKQELTRALLHGEVKKIIVTFDSLIDGLDFKISRRKIAKKYAAGLFNELNGEGISFEEIHSGLERDVLSLFASALGKAPEELSLTGNFFLDFGGSSLEYFALADLIKAKYNAVLPMTDGSTLSTVKEVCEYLKNK